MSRKYLVLVIAILGTASACAQPGGPQPSTTKSDAKADAKITLVRAIEIAQKEAKEGELLVQAEFLPEEAPPVYLVKFLVAGKIKEVWIESKDGHVQGVRTREVVPEHRDWAEEFPSVVGKFGKSALQMLKELTDHPGGITDVTEIKYARERGEWSFTVVWGAEQSDKPKQLDKQDITYRAFVRCVLGGDKHHSEQVEFYVAVRFDTEPSGAVPSGWSIQQTHPTKALATWKLVVDPTAPSKPNVLALTHSENVDGTFNLAIFPLKYQDVDLSVQMKAVEGKEDQGGGLIWRCKDENNYYVCRLNPLENNFRVYVVKDGVRKQLQSVEAQSVAGRWYPLAVRMAGKHIVCYLDDKKMLEVDDATFVDAGMIGLWTKADAVTSFDDLIITDLKSVKPLATTEPAKQ
jgi:hypothetical protein